MLFNSIDFAVFLPIVFIFYWFVTNRNLRFQNLLIIVASYLFYGWWDWRFLSLLFFTTVVDYSIGLALSNQENSTKRKFLLWTSIFINLGLLGFFKYYNFFLDNFVTAFSIMGVKLHANSINIILPIGISFYTFQSLSYSIDVYARKLEPTKDFIAFCAFVSFFPQLVAGPIGRAANLLPQYATKRLFNYSKATDGLKQILWGLFKKVVIADNCAEFANEIFNNSNGASGSTLALGAIFFTFQIYGDFSGYSDIAIGTGRLFGINLMRNFAFPYFSRDVIEFWRRWHISLSTWFRDYLFFPIAYFLTRNLTQRKYLGIRSDKVVLCIATLLTFLFCGFWHGANWTFIFWGGLIGIYFIPLILTNQNRKNLDTVAEGKHLPSIKETIQMLTTFILISFSWIFFRAENIHHAVSYYSGLLSASLFSIPYFPGIRRAMLTILFIAIFLIIEWMGRKQQHALAELELNWKKPIRYVFYYALIFAIYHFAGAPQEFIYFQF